MIDRYWRELFLNFFREGGKLYGLRGIEIIFGFYKIISILF